MSAFRRELVLIPSGWADWTATLAQHAGLFSRIPMPEGVGAGRAGHAILRSVKVVSLDANDWEFWFWATGKGQSGHPDTDIFLGRVSLVASTDAKQIAATGLYYFSKDSLDVPIEDRDAHDAPVLGSFLYVTLVNRSAGAKTANGWFQVTFGLEPTLGS